MVDDRPTVPLLLYLHADKLMPPCPHLRDSTWIPCSQQPVETRTLAPLLLAGALWSLQQQRLLDLEVTPNPHHRALGPRDDIRVTLLQRAMRPGLEGAILNCCDRESCLHEVIAQWSTSNQSDPWHDTIDAVRSEAVDAGYLKPAPQPAGLIERVLTNSPKYEVDCPRIAALADAAHDLATSWKEFERSESTLHEKLLSHCRKSLTDSTECWYA